MQYQLLKNSNGGEHVYRVQFRIHSDADWQVMSGTATDNYDPDYTFGPDLPVLEFKYDSSARLATREFDLHLKRSHEKQFVEEGPIFSSL